MREQEDSRPMVLASGAVIGQDSQPPGVGVLELGRDVRLDLLQGFQLVCSAVVVDLPLSAQRVLAFLALHTRSLTRSYVAATLWMDCAEERAGASLRSALWRINRP